ncbi:putative bifunctional diguanylate cyclase/phosphodiesterase [Methylogaea oryzae]|uniref:putative bifunctional diguanylate cyclase/phosphodiesterase n=1 Tax=Methylogaea oryzae TaxID=1295382 RepID=UPI0006D03699|nr:diguanylate cyclase [Methylogaea oryzae]
MIITDADCVILRVNQAFTDITGYTAEEAIGRKMNLLKSGRHDAAFYKAMWQSIADTGSWQGEVWNRRKNGEIYPEWLTITAVYDATGTTSHYVGTLTDITARKSAEDEIRNLAFFDPLTQLPNRMLLADRMRQTLARARRTGELIAVCMLDLDGFKAVNDSLGHHAGDQLLREVAQRLLDCIRQEDTAARLGGDEFALLLGGFQTNGACEQTLGRIVSLVANPYQVAGQSAKVSASIGVTLYPSDGSAPDLLLRHADQSMYEAKQAGKNRYHIFDPSIDQRQHAKQSTLKKIGKALNAGQFVLYYQPRSIAAAAKRWAPKPWCAGTTRYWACWDRPSSYRCWSTTT